MKDSSWIVWVVVITTVFADLWDLFIEQRFFLSPAPFLFWNFLALTLLIFLFFDTYKIVKRRKKGNEN